MPITELVIPLGSIGAIAAMIWGVAKFVESSRMSDTETSRRLDARDKADTTRAAALVAANLDTVEYRTATEGRIKALETK